MQMPLTLEMIAPRATADRAGARAQIPALRLPAAAWSALIALPAADESPASADSAQLGESLLALARLLDGALRNPPAPLPLRLEAPASASAGTAASAQLAAPGAPAAPTQLANALAAAVAGSGVFFESHLAEWVRGTRDAAPILVEAQARLEALAIAPEATGEAAFRQQLASLVTGELAFQFAAWPGQNATLTIGREPEQAPPAAVPERAFLADLELAMPELGSVRATLNLNARGIDIDVSAATTASAQTLRAARDSLVQALAAAQLQVGRIEVRHEQS